MLPPNLTRCFGVTDPARASLNRFVLGVLNSNGVGMFSEVGGTFSSFSCEGGAYWFGTVRFAETKRVGFGESRTMGF